jgi:hypothetical protein
MEVVTMVQNFVFQDQIIMGNFVELLENHYPNIELVVNQKKLRVSVKDAERYRIVTSYPYYRSDK